MSAEHDDGPLWAAAERGDVAAVRRMLDAGVDPNDGESLYHSATAGDVTCMRLLLEAGALIPGSNALYHILDVDNLAGLQLLLAYGADADEDHAALGRPLQHALRRDRSQAHVEALLAAGADPRARTRTGVPLGLVALWYGRPEIAACLGFDVPLSTEDAFVAACARADRDEAQRIAAAHPGIVRALSADQLETLPLLTQVARRDAVETLLAFGWPVGVRGGELNASALNYAVFRGDPELTRILLDHGARWTEEHRYGDNVVGTLSFASRETPHSHGDWLGCARELIAHGMPPPAPRYRFSAEIEAFFATISAA